MNLLQQRKLALACARAELVKVGKNLPQLLQNLDSGNMKRNRLRCRAILVMCHRN